MRYLCTGMVTWPDGDEDEDEDEDDGDWGIRKP